MFYSYPQNDTCVQKDMKCWQLLFGLWCCGILAVTSGIEADVPSWMCVTDYIHNITCVFNNITAIPLGKNKTNYSLYFKENSEHNPSCPLVVMNHSYYCECQLNNKLWADYNSYEIDICDESQCINLENKFNLANHIQLKPPPELVVQETTETLNITFKSRYDNHLYLGGYLMYEILLQTPESSENKTFTVPPQKKFESINRKLHLKNSEYCIKARYRPQTYSETWSEWSQPTCWENKAEEEPETLLLLLAKYLFPLCLVLGALLFVFYSPAARMKIKTLSHTPSPAPFFQPLYQQHKGDLQEWLSPKGKNVLMHKADEGMISDRVAVVPKPNTKDPEETQTFLNPPVIQLAFPQCQTSYVGLPGMDMAPAPIAMVCPANTSYTQLPCSVWERGREAEIASSPPEDVLDISCVDSGCSFEDVTQSPECSLPSSPVVETLAPCYCSDYCILNKTAEGVVPVLLSKESNVKVSSDSQHERES
uniref:interleukin-21 receptor isoform X1 n=2 Tax=Maylandia zebra TaxID=106582 RepID=UPI0006CF19CD|nr:interleukin-21 receptor isoform X1 [Maylandia zebra]